LHPVRGIGTIEHVFDTVTHLDELRCWSIDALFTEYTRLDALEAQVRSQRLLVLAVLDERGVGGNGDSRPTRALDSCAHSSARRSRSAREKTARGRRSTSAVPMR
jgi:hypothetical protein